MLTLNDIHQYIFNNRAEINLDHVPSDKQVAYKEKKQQAIRALFTQSLKIENNDKFRSLLRHLSATALEETLFGNATDAIVETSVPFPENNVIKSHFIELNSKYGFFNEHKLEEKAHEDYLEIFKVCKFVGDFIECNNDQEDDVAALHAYKLLILFSENNNHFQAIDKYIHAYNKECKTSLHDTLVSALPVNTDNLDLQGWRKLIHTYQRALSYFANAPAINKMLGDRAPHNLDELELAAEKIHYQRRAEYPELARLCEIHHLPEEIFNKCLTLELTRKKTDDNLPNALFDGKEVGHEGYFLTKLPFDDPRAYILGEITDCCQSIGKFTERCVIDGITRENNGFYVLLKRKNNKVSNSPILPNGKLNHGDYDIVGQSYAWISDQDNLTFDSWENLRDSDDSTIFDMLKPFGKLLAEKNTSILRVTLGLGGGTPEIFEKDDLELAYPEHIKEGYDCGDSDEQTLIYINVQKEQEIKEAIHRLILKLHKQYPEITIEDFETIFCKNEIISSNASRILETLMSSTDNNACIDVKNSLIYTLLSHWSFSELKAFIKKIGPNFWQYLYLLKTHDLLNEQSIKQACDLADLSKFSDFLCAATILTNITDSTSHIKLFNQEYINLLFDNRFSAKKLALELMKLQDSNLLNSELQSLIFSEPSYSAMRRCKGFRYLNQANLYPRYKQLLISPTYSYGADTISKAFAILNKINFLNDATEKMIIQSTQHVTLAKAICLLATNDLFNDETYKILKADQYICYKVAQALVMLKENGIYCSENINAILDITRSSPYSRSDYPKKLASSLCTLHKFNVLDDRSRWLLKEMKYSYLNEIEEMFSCLCDLQAAGIYNDKTIKILAENRYNPTKRSKGLIALSKHHLLSDVVYEIYRAGYGMDENEANHLIDFVNVCNLDDTQRQFILSDHEKLRSLWDGVDILVAKNNLTAENGMRLLENIDIAPSVATLVNGTTDAYADNLALLLEKPERADLTTRSLLKLSKHHFLNDVVRSFISQHNELSKEISMAIAVLHDNHLLDESNWHYFIEFEQQALAFCIDIARVIDLMQKGYFLNHENKQFLANNLKYLADIEDYINTMNKVRQYRKELFHLIILKPSASNQLANVIETLDSESLLSKHAIKLIEKNIDSPDEIVVELIALNKANKKRLNEFENQVENLQFNSDSDKRHSKEILDDFCCFFRWHNRGKPPEKTFHKWIAEYEERHYKNPLKALETFNNNTTDSNTFFQSTNNKATNDYEKLFAIIIKPTEAPKIIDEKETFRRLFYR